MCCGRRVDLRGGRRFPACDPIRAGHHQPGDVQRSAQTEKARRSLAADIRAGDADPHRSRPWRLQTFLEMCGATGCRRREVLALRWRDVQANTAYVDRSLCQTKEGLAYKGPKTEKPRKIAAAARFTGQSACKLPKGESGQGGAALPACRTLAHRCGSLFEDQATGTRKQTVVPVT